MPITEGEGNHPTTDVAEEAVPDGSSLKKWVTASPDTDATKPETMPRTKSTPMPGETKYRRSV